MKNNLTKEEKNSNLSLTDYDVCELFIRCNEVYVNTSSKLDVESSTAIKRATELWEATLEKLKEYRESNP